MNLLPRSGHKKVPRLSGPVGAPFYDPMAPFYALVRAHFCAQSGAHYFCDPGAPVCAPLGAGFCAPVGAHFCAPSGLLERGSAPIDKLPQSRTESYEII